MSCAAALALDLDSVELVRGRGQGDGLLSQYVNDQPYIASSMLSVAMSRLFGTAMNGRCDQRPELAPAELPLELRIVPLPCRGGEALLRRLFEPLGYAVEATQAPLDPAFPDWGDSRYFDVRLTRTARLAGVSTQIYALAPVLDDDKQALLVGDDELEKLLARGEVKAAFSITAQRPPIAVKAASRRARGTVQPRARAVGCRSRRALPWPESPPR